ncbi:MAG TPA: energy-coupling factor transporter ATPase [Clostridiales bacterium]|jgi:energy-coupling factor transport system ATP-binding protein|nr:energy-coupling factor transporter ATPase [Clostridiales bacterium]
MNVILEAQNVVFAYENEDVEARNAVENVSLSIERGSFVAILGQNGSGKSTLAKLFNGILLPLEGKILVDGMDTTHEDQLINIRKRVGMVFQNPDNQLVATVVEEDVAFAPENLGVPTNEIRLRVDKALDVVGMREYAHHAPHQLSGGQKQRVAIAGILAMGPECIIFDESTAMLDPRGREEIMETIRHLNRVEQKTIVLITHYMEEAALADRVVVIHDGTIRLDGKSEEVFRHQNELYSIGLSLPQATDLIARLEESGLYPELQGKTALTEEEAAVLLESILK